MIEKYNQFINWLHSAILNSRLKTVLKFLQNSTELSE